MAVLGRWLPYTVTILGRLHCMEVSQYCTAEGPNSVSSRMLHRGGRAYDYVGITAF